MKIPLIYNLRSVMQRPTSTAFTAIGIGLVVAVFIGMLALANGFRAALARTGSDQNALVLRRGADSELSSGLGRESASILAASPHVAPGPDGRPLFSAESYLLIPLSRRGADTSTVANVVVRGVAEAAWRVRQNLVITEGQAPVPGRNEVCVGRTMALKFPNTDVGQSLRFGGRDWAVVCHFTAGGSSFESEVWGDAEQFQPVFRREGFSSASFRLADPAAFDEAKRALESDQRLQVDVYRESAFYAEQSEVLGRILEILAFLITSIMAVGAVFGAVNTMYAAVAARGPEIAVLLTLGFHPRSVLLSFLVESALIALVGGVLGILLVLPVNGMVTSTTNWASFSEIAFSFRITPSLLLSGVIFAAVMGTLGGFFPAWRAARRPVVQALR